MPKLCQSLQPYHVRKWTNMALHTALHITLGCMAYRHCMPLHIRMHMTCLWRARGWTALSGTLRLSALFAPTHPSPSVRTPVFSGHTCVACPPVLTLRFLAFCGLSRPCRGLVWRAASYAYALLSVFLSRCWTSHAHTRTLRAQGRLSEDHRATGHYRANRTLHSHISSLSVVMVYRSALITDNLMSHVASNHESPIELCPMSYVQVYRFRFRDPILYSTRSPLSSHLGIV